jgi:hypothetical protein
MLIKLFIFFKKLSSLRKLRTLVYEAEIAFMDQLLELKVHER